MAEAVEHIIVETPAVEAPASQVEVIEAVAEADVAVIEARSEAAVAEIAAAGEAAVAVAEIIEEQKDEQWQTVTAEMGALSARIANLEAAETETQALLSSILARLPPPPNPPSAEMIAEAAPAAPAVLIPAESAVESPAPPPPQGRRPRHAWL